LAIPPEVPCSSLPTIHQKTTAWTVVTNWRQSLLLQAGVVVGTTSKFHQQIERPCVWPHTQRSILMTIVGIGLQTQRVNELPKPQDL